MGGKLGFMTLLNVTAEPKPDKEGFTSEGILALDSPEKESTEERGKDKWSITVQSII